MIATDFKSFFETIDHAELKSSLCKVLGVDLLPDDYYAVFKNTTRYSSWDWDSLVRLSGLEGCRSARKEMNAKERLLNTEEFKKNVKSNIELNTSGKGVPQGSPVSAVYSNIYLLDFDLAIKDIVDSAGGMYLRYCDDVFIAIPIKKDFHAALQVVENALKCVEQKEGFAFRRKKRSVSYFGKTVVLVGLYQWTQREMQK